jgi:two-component system chemotaxis sensor kinase CheA
MMPPIPDHLVAAYREEATGLLAEFEAALLALERTPADADLVDRAYRALHTVRGSAAMFRLDELAAFAPEVEAVLDAVRDGWVRMTPELVTLLLQARDLLRDLLDGNAPEGGGRARLVDALRARLPTPETVLPAGPPLARPTPPPEGRKTFRLRFRPHPDLFQNGTNVLGLLGELRTLGRYQAVARTDALPRLEELAPETCTIGCDVVLTTDRGLAAVLDAFAFVDGRCELKVEVVDDERTPGVDVRLGQILVDRGEVSPEVMDRVLAQHQRIGELLEAEGLVSAEAVEAAVLEQKVVREERQRRDGAAQADGASWAIG